MKTPKEPLHPYRLNRLFKNYGIYDTDTVLQVIAVIREFTEEDRLPSDPFQRYLLASKIGGLLKEKGQFINIPPKRGRGGYAYPSPFIWKKFNGDETTLYPKRQWTWNSFF